MNEYLEFGEEEKEKRQFSYNSKTLKDLQKLAKKEDLAPWVRG